MRCAALSCERRSTHPEDYQLLCEVFARLGSDFRTAELITLTHPHSPALTDCLIRPSRFGATA